MYAVSLDCIACGRKYHLDQPINACSHCHELLEVTYDHTGLQRKALTTRQKDFMWRYTDFLPLNPDDAITLGEGCTPLIHAKALGTILGLPHLFLKLDFMCPTGSFKDRGASVMVSIAKHHNRKSLVIDSSGNAAAAVAAYAAAASLKCYVFSPAYASADKLIQSLAYGATVFAVEGTRLDTYEITKAAYEHFQWYYCGFQTNPYAIEGLKTVAFEICEQLAWTSPDFVVLPVGTGSNLIGCWKGLFELYQIGWVHQVSSLACIQPEGCAPIARAYIEGSPTITPIPNPQTIAEGLMISNPLKGEQVLKSISESNGVAEIVSDSEIMAATTLLAKTEGVFVEPSSATALAGVMKLVDEGHLPRDNRIVCVLTGSGLKTSTHFAEVIGSPVKIKPELAAVTSFVNQRV